MLPEEIAQDLKIDKEKVERLQREIQSKIDYFMDY